MEISRTVRFFGRAQMALAFFVLASAVACGGGGGGGGASSTPTQPSAPSTPANVNGTWSGSASDSSGPGQMSWQLTQSNTSFSGPVSITDTSTGVTGQGTVTGTVSSSSITFSITIPAGGFGSPYATCSANVSGNGQVASTAITGTYTGSSSCSGAIASGQLTLNKQ